MFTDASVQFSRSVVSDSLRPHESQHARPPCPSPTPRVYSNPCASSQWCHPAISSSVVPFSPCPQSLPASVNLPVIAGDAHSIPDPGRSHMPGAAKPMYRNYWACALEPMSRNKRNHCNETAIHHNYRKAWAATKTQHSQWINQYIFLKYEDLKKKKLH